MNDHGNLLDVFVILVIVFFLGIAAVSLIFVQKAVSSGLNTTLSSINSSSTVTGVGQTINSNVDNNTGWVIDFVLIMIMFSLPLLSMILAFFNNINPIFFWASFGLTMLVIVVASWFSIAYGSFISNNGLAVAASSLPMVNFIMTNFIIYAMYCTFCIAIGVFVKAKDANTGGMG